MALKRSPWAPCPPAVCGGLSRKDTAASWLRHLQPVFPIEWISKKQSSGSLHPEMFREWGLAGLPAEMRLSRNSFQCEHFLKCFSLIVVVVENVVVCRQSGRASLMAWLPWRVCLYSRSSQRNLLCTEEGQSVPLRTKAKQNKMKTLKLQHSEHC